MTEHKLKRELGLLQTIMIGVGASIGAGVFVLLGQAASMAGPAVIVGLLLSGIINLFTIFSFCELGAALPEVGGEHVYVRTAFGGLLGFITGWFEWMSEMFYAVLMALGAALMLSSYFPILQGYITLVAVLLVVVFTIINIKGTKETGTTAVVLGITLIIILGIYVVSGWLHGFRPDAFEPFMPYGIFPVMTATAYLFVVYLGAEDIVIAQGEVKDPSKTIPRAIILNAGILILVYTIVAYTTIGIVPPAELGASPAPLRLAAEKTMGSVGGIVVTIAGLVAAFSSLNTAIMAQSRAVYSMGKEGYFPRFLAKIHRRFGTPYVAVIFTSAITLLFTATGNLSFASYASGFGFLIGYSLTNLALMKLRRAKPYMERPFKVPLYPVTPIIGVIASVGLMAFIQPVVLALGVELGLVALLIYYVSMLGYHRVRVAIGGISLSIGIATLLFAYLVETGIITLTISQSLLMLLPYGLVAVGSLFVAAGILHITVKT